MPKVKYLVLPLITFFLSCNIDNSDSKYLRWVGDSEYEAQVDDPEFKLCRGENKVAQYFHFQKGLQYKGEKSALVDHFMTNYEAVETDQSGWVRIRFIVNCEGQAGRFRLISSDDNYNERAFDKNITDQLMQLTKALDGWTIQKFDDTAADFYQYLVFKIDQGKITKIMP